MDSKLFCVFLICAVVWTSERWVMSMSITTIEERYIQHFKRVSSIVSSYNDNEFVKINHCGGVLTEAPGEIVRHYDSKNPIKENCTWKIHAPANHSVYVIEFDNVVEAESDPLKIEDDSITVEIYDGNEVLEDKRLFLHKNKSGYNSATIDNCTSNAHDLTIDLHYNESGKYLSQKMKLRYGFIFIY